MQTAGFLDTDGKPIDVDAHRRKLFVIAQELAQAEAVERHRAREKEMKKEQMMILAPLGRGSDGGLDPRKRHEVFQQRVHAVQAIRQGRKRRQHEKVGSNGEA